MNHEADGPLPRNSDTGAPTTKWNWRRCWSRIWPISRRASQPTLKG